MCIQMPVEDSGSQSPVLNTGISKNYSSKRRHSAICSHISPENQSQWPGLGHSNMEWIISTHRVTLPNHTMRPAFLIVTFFGNETNTKCTSVTSDVWFAPGRNLTNVIKRRRGKQMGKMCCSERKYRHVLVFKEAFFFSSCAAFQTSSTPRGGCLFLTPEKSIYN